MDDESGDQLLQNYMGRTKAWAYYRDNVLDYNILCNNGQYIQIATTLIPTIL